MKRVLVLLALLASACGLPKSRQPATREQACAARNQSVSLGVLEFCNVGGVAQCGLKCAGGRACSGQMECRPIVQGNQQTVCDTSEPDGSPPLRVAVGECVDGHGACPPWWQCVTMSIGDAAARSYCVPGPPCDDSDASL